MKKLIITIATLSMLLPAISYAGKMKIAVGEIEYRAKDSSENKKYSAYGSGSREDTRAFVDMLTTALVKTRKFNVVERDRMTEILKEQGLSLQGIASGTNNNTLNLQGVNYIITGAITEYGENEKSFKLAGFSTSNKIASMAVDIRILDVKNGSIKLAETIKKEVKSAGSINVKDFSTGNDKSSGSLLGQVMRNTATDVTNLVVSSIFPIKVVAVTKQGYVMLNYGNGFLHKGDQLEVFSMGEVFIDPDTKEPLGSEEELVGKLSVFNTQSKFSKARILEKNQEIEKGMIARIIKNNQPTQNNQKNEDIVDDILNKFW